MSGKFPMPHQDPECEIHHHLMCDGRCSCLPVDQVFGAVKTEIAQTERELMCLDEGCPHFGVDHGHAPHLSFNCAGEARIGLPSNPYGFSAAIVMPLCGDVFDYKVGETKPSRVEYSRPRDVDSCTVARGMANLLARYAASIENAAPRYPGDDQRARATLAAEMACIYFRAAELEEKP